MGIPKGGRSEHDTWKIETSSGAFVIRRTINDAYGFHFSSPFQYLRRMAEFSDQVPVAAVRFPGVSLNKRGNGVIWTVRPYIEGTHPTQAELVAELKSQGWQPAGSLHNHLVFQHIPTGIRMRDVHAGKLHPSENRRARPHRRLLPRHSTLRLTISRARHMDPKASSTRDQPASGMFSRCKNTEGFLVGVLDVAKRSPKGEQPGGGCESKRRFAGGGSFREAGAGGTILGSSIIFVEKVCPQVHGLNPRAFWIPHCVTIFHSTF